MTGKQIKALRVALEMSQARFGDEIGVHAVTVGRWERGRKNPSPMALRAIHSLAHRVLARPTQTLNDLLRQVTRSVISTAEEK